jgi:hypothetical protein
VWIVEEERGAAEEDTYYLLEPHIHHRHHHSFIFGVLLSATTEDQGWGKGCVSLIWMGMGGVCGRPGVCAVVGELGVGGMGWLWGRSAFFSASSPHKLRRLFTRRGR